MRKSAKTPEPSPEIQQYDGKPIQSDETAKRLTATPAGRDLVVTSISTYQGRRSLDIRRFYLAEDDTWKPTSKGVRIPAPQVARFLDAVCPLREELRKEFADA